jgi:hypothetical protein
VLQLEDLVASASDVRDLGGGVGRCRDRTTKSTFYNYVKFAAANTDGNDLLITSENILDDDFAMLIFANVPSEERSERLSNLKALDLPKNEYGFSALLLAPKDYHSHFAGRLDAKRDRLVWCLPIHRCEFSGDESVEEFFTLCWRGFVPTLNWQREVCPKIILRYDNPKTQGGTVHDCGVFAKYETVLREVDLLSGVPKGFIEITNNKKQVIEILSPKEGVFVLIRERDDATREPLNKPTLLQKLQSFLVQPT